MTSQTLLLIGCLAPSGVLLFLLLSPRTPPRNRRILLFALPVFFLTDGFIAYKLVGPGRAAESVAEPVAETGTEVSTADALLKFPPAAQNFPLTLACRRTQKQLLEGFAKEKKLPAQDSELAILITCTCVTAGLMADPSFAEINRQAEEGKDFLSLFVTYQKTMVKAMQPCSKPEAP